MRLSHRLVMAMLKRLPRHLVKRFALRYIAGETMDDAVRVMKSLNERQILGTIDVLGENVVNENDVDRTSRACEEVLLSIRHHKLDANLSVKLTQLGLNIDETLCLSHLRRLLQVARSGHNFIRIDMEESSKTDQTLRAYETVRSEGYENVGIVIQAYLKRSRRDIEHLSEMKANVRLCKGAYQEPDSVALKDREQIRNHYVMLAERLLRAGCTVGIATHDSFLVRQTYRFILEMKLKPSQVEFQMLHGVKPRLRDRIVADGHRLRVYVPFGEEWYAYSIRRFQENPELLQNVLRALFTRD